MSLLNEVLSDAAKDEVPVSFILRKCVRLAAQSRNSEFSKWVHLELFGYEEKDQVPPYRIFRPEVFKGNFHIIDGGGTIQHILPTAQVEKYLSVVKQDFVTTYSNVRELEKRLSRNRDDEFKLFWHQDTTDRFARVFGKIFPGEVCYQAWHVWYRHDIEELLENVRLQILTYTAHIKEDEMADELTNAKQDNGATHHTTNNFNGTAGNVAIGSSSFSQQATIGSTYTQQNLNVDMAALVQDLARLRTALRDQDLDPEHYEALGAIRSAEIEAAKPEGERDQSKIMGALKKAGQWALTAANSIVATVAAEAIKQSLGMGSHP